MDVVKLLTKKFLFIIIEQKDNYDYTGFITACDCNSLDLVKLFLDQYSFVINQKNIFGCTGFELLSVGSKKGIA